jgi:Mn-dependent DtxR family transcriptional regulator
MAKDTQAELLKLIQSAQKRTDDGSITSKELSKLLHCSRNKALEIIHDLIDAGVMEPCQSQRQQVTKVWSPTWAYRLVA